MTYATQDDMIAAFGAREVTQLTDRDLLGIIDPAVLSRALANATVEIDAYLQSRFALPLVNVPPLLIQMCCDIARYLLTGAEAQETDPSRQRYKDAIRRLEQIRDGKMALGMDALGAETGTRTTVLISDGRRAINADALSDY